ncbi:chromosome partitioning protein [Actinoplanes nipponensis]|uniref:MinD/ParA family ATP-binding protein n=1 Tax=Actinoplanes nipponensis TaxID=135950 RepID=UPI003F693E25
MSSSAPAHFPTVTPRRTTDNGDEQGSGTVYRPGPVGPDTPRPNTAAQAGSVSQPGPQSGPAATPPPHQTFPHQTAPTPPGQHQPGPTPPAPHQPGHTPPGPHQPGYTPLAPHGPGPTTPGPHQTGPALTGPHQTGSHQTAPTPGPIPPGPPTPGPGPMPHQPGPIAPGPLPAPPPGPTNQTHPHPGHPGPGSRPMEPQQWPANAQPVPGPFPPTVDPRVVPPHPHPPHQGEQPGPHQQPPPVDPYQQLPWVSDGTPTAEEFARRRLAKPAEPTATMGARAILQKGTMGLVRLAPGKREQEYKQDVEMVRRNFGGLRQVTVVNPKGGAGKTVAVLLLAMTFGQKRGGYVLAWDNNETQGTLGMRAQQDFHARTVRDMMRDLHLFRGSHGRVGDLSQYVRAQGEGMFDVLASDESATAGEMLTASAFAEIREIVSRFYKLIFVDTGNNVRAQNWQAAMDATDQLVITMSARNDSAETAARMLDHLEQSGRQRLVRQAVSVVTMPPTRKDIDLPAIQRHFAARTRAVLLAPYEKLIDSGEPLRYGQLSTSTRDSWLKIASAVAEGL